MSTMMPSDEGRTVDETMTTAHARAILLGQNHERPGTSATASVDGRGAIAIARGWLPKPYAYVDPNEDAVALVAGRRANLLVVADGHYGRSASHTAVQVAVDLLGRDPRPADLSEHEVVAAASLLEQRIGLTRPAGSRPSRTTLVVALHAPGRLQWFAGGDSSLFAGNRDLVDVLPSATNWFFGDRLSQRALRKALAHDTVALGPDDWVVAATDGYTDYLPAGLMAPQAVQMALQAPARTTSAFADTANVAADETALDPVGVVAAVLDQARRGGAGDNVAAVACRPW